MHLNVQSLRNKKLELEVFLSGNKVKYNFLCVTEHWMSEAELKSFNLAGFRLADLFCRTSKKNGGSCIFVKTSDLLKLLYRRDLNVYGLEQSFELSVIEAKLKNLDRNVIVVCLYRSPSSNCNTFFKGFNNILSKIVNENKYIVLCGDWNIDFLKDTREKRVLESLFKTFNLTNAIDGPTRITKSTSTSLDYIVTGSPHSGFLSSIVPLDLSDHNGVDILLKSCMNLRRSGPGSGALRKKVRMVLDRDFPQINLNLKVQPWRKVFSSVGVEEMFDAFLNIYLSCCDAVVPVRTITRPFSGNRCWVTRGIKISSLKLKTFHSLLQSSNTNNMIISISTKTGLTYMTLNDYYKKYKTVYQNVLKSAKRMSINNYINNAKNINQAVWRVVKQETCKSKPLNSVTLIRNNKGDNVIGKEAANVINNYFIDLPIDLLKNNLNIYNNTEIHRTTYRFDNSALNSSINDFWCPTNENEVEIIIRKLKNKKSNDIYNISNFLVKNTYKYILKPLTYICNESLTSGIIPAKLKNARISPLYKSGDRGLPENYRPISCLPIFSKILEGLVLNRLNAFLDKTRLISPCQFGFRSHTSTNQALFEYLDAVFQSVDKKEKVIGVFADIKKAFDMVCHEILLHKLNAYGIKGVPLTWFKSYLTDRHQRVELESNGVFHFSHWAKVRFGVPQGSILGPALFIIYINDLPDKFVSTRVVLYADDTTLMIKHKCMMELQSLCNSSLVLLDNWLKNNMLYLNTCKTKFIDFRNKTDRLTLKIGDTNIESTSNSKMLGIIVDDQLTWKYHIKHVINKLCTAVYALRKLYKLLDTNVLRTVYFAYIQSVLSYGLIFWGGSSELEDVFVIQKWAIRIMKGLNKRTSCRNHFKELHILPLPSLYIFEILNFTKRNIKRFNMNSDFHEYNTRNRNNLRDVSHRMSLYEHSPRSVGISLYNQLPLRIRNLNVIDFKATVRGELEFNCFYSVKEFEKHYQGIK